MLGRQAKQDSRCRWEVSLGWKPASESYKSNALATIALASVRFRPAEPHPSADSK